MAEITTLTPSHDHFASLGGFFDRYGYGVFSQMTFAHSFSHPSYGAKLIYDNSDESRVPMTGVPIIGAVLYRMLGDEIELIECATHHAHYRKGIASALLTDLIVMATIQGHQRLVLEVAETNQAAIGLYQTCGFASVGHRPAYYQQKIDALIMELWLSKA